jgi:hypothetical protein
LNENNEERFVFAFAFYRRVLDDLYYSASLLIIELPARLAKMVKPALNGPPLRS